MTLPPMVRRRRRSPGGAVPVPAPGTTMPDGTTMTGCSLWGGDRPHLVSGTRASSVDDHGQVRLWRWTARHGWLPDCDGEAQGAA